MGWMQKCCQTYDNNAYLAGKEQNGAVLCPIYFISAKADIEITITEQGVFFNARKVDKTEAETLIPATEESAARSGSKAAPHPLCDNLGYIVFGHESVSSDDKYKEKYEKYIAQLEEWANSDCSHFMVKAVLQYCKGGTCLKDLSAFKDLLNTDKGEFDLPKNEKLFVRWRVLNSFGEDDQCWTSQSLIKAYQDYYRKYVIPKLSADICYVSGEMEAVQSVHPRGIISKPNGAKIISSNDSEGYTYRGRFTEPSEALAVSVTATQKAHNALRWLVKLQGKTYGNRTFVIWNSEGAKAPQPEECVFSDDEKAVCTEPVKYREKLSRMMNGYKEAFEKCNDRGVQIIALEAASKGRLSITYYNELDGCDYIDRLERWFSSLNWWRRAAGTYTVETPKPEDIVRFAFGVQRSGKTGKKVEVDENVLGSYRQNLLKIIVDCAKMPVFYKNALVQKCSLRQAYETDIYEQLLSVTCAVIKKYYSDNKKEICMELQQDECDRSYLFGRLLAVAEYVERRANGSQDKDREPNAVRLQAAFVQHPMRTWMILESALIPYYAKLNLGGRMYLKNLIGEIVGKIRECDEGQLNKPLTEKYLIGYYLQRKELYTKKSNDMEEN